MKRTFSLLICILLLSSMIALPVAAEEEDQIIISQTVEDLGDGRFYIETITVPSIQPYSHTKVGSKTAVYVVSGQSIYSVTVNGTFSYDGNSSSATDATGSLATYVEGVTVEDKDAYTSGASAYAMVIVRYQGVRLTKTVKLTCDKDGNLS